MTTTQDRIPPLTPEDSDLRKSHPWMPVDVQALLRSTFTIRSSGDEFKAGVLLWFESWHQTPAASLPNDDLDLCYLAGLGRDMDKWNAVKAMAMRNFTLASDGRWYHRVVAEKANEVFEEQKRKSEQGKKGAKKRWTGDDSQGDLLDQCPGNAPALPDQCQGTMPGQCPPNANTLEHTTLKQNTEGLPPSQRAGGRPCKIPEKWTPSRAEIRVGIERGLSEKETRRQAARFHNFWLAKSGKDAVKADWLATWRNWIDGEAEKLGRKPAALGQGQVAPVREIPRHGEVITAAMCTVEFTKPFVGMVWLHRDSSEYGAWQFHLCEDARKRGQNPPVMKSGFNQGWAFPSRWPPGYVQGNQTANAA